jgi:hypothetical protein
MIEWNYNQRYFIKQAALNGDDLSVYRLIDDFCIENDCTVTVFDTIVCSEEQFIMIKITHPEVILGIIKVHSGLKQS